MFIITLEGRYWYQSDFKMQYAGTERLFNLPKVTQPIRHRIKL